MSTKAVTKSLTTSSIPDLRSLNAALFPVPYSNNFYTEALNGPAELTRLVFQHDTLIAAVCCIIDQHGDLYIRTLGVRPAYRERGIGTALLQHVLRTAETAEICTDIRRIYMHVQEGNEDALGLYKKYGFHVKTKLLHYYSRVDPPHCFELEKIVQSRILSHNVSPTSHNSSHRVDKH